MSEEFTKRQPTQPANPNWPFLYSVVPGRGVVLNVAPRARTPLLPTPAETLKWPFGRQDPPEDAPF